LWKSVNRILLGSLVAVVCLLTLPGRAVEGPIRQPIDQVDRESRSKDQQVSEEKRTIDTRPFISKHGLYQSLEASVKDLESSDTIIAGIVPHHNVASRLIGDFYQRVQKSHQAAPYDLVVVISPNHKYIGESLQYGYDDFKTYGDGLMTDKVLSDYMSDNTSGVRALQVMLEQEHGQLIHMSYIDLALDQVPVLSIVVSSLVEDNMVQKAVEELIKATEGQRVLYIASIDFSHGLAYEEAEEKDQYTRQLLMTNDTGRMSVLDDRWLDSPNAYKFLMMCLEAKGGPVAKIINHSNSAILLNHYQSPNTTSYFEVIYMVE